MDKILLIPSIVGIILSHWIDFSRSHLSYLYWVMTAFIVVSVIAMWRNRLNVRYRVWVIIIGLIFTYPIISGYNIISGVYFSNVVALSLLFIDRWMGYNHLGKVREMIPASVDFYSMLLGDKIVGYMAFYGGNRASRCFYEDLDSENFDLMPVGYNDVPHNIAKSLVECLVSD